MDTTTKETKDELPEPKGDSSQKEHIVPLPDAEKNKGPESILPGTVSKAQIADKVFESMYDPGKGKTPARKDILNEVQKQAHLTPAAAATYFQNWKSKKGYTNQRGSRAGGAPSLSGSGIKKKPPQG